MLHLDKEKTSMGLNKENLPNSYNVHAIVVARRVAEPTVSSH